MIMYMHATFIVHACINVSYLLFVLFCYMYLLIYILSYLFVYLISLCISLLIYINIKLFKIEKWKKEFKKSKEAKTS